MVNRTGPSIEPCGTPLARRRKVRFIIVDFDDQGVDLGLGFIQADKLRGKLEIELFMQADYMIYCTENFS